jgi:hypothetical protein
VISPTVCSAFGIGEKGRTGIAASERRIVGDSSSIVCLLGLEGALGGVSQILGDPTKADSGNQVDLGEGFGAELGTPESKTDFDFPFTERSGQTS